MRVDGRAGDVGLRANTMVIPRPTRSIDVTDIIDEGTSADDTPAPPDGQRFADRDPIFGDSPEGVDVWQRVPYDADDYGPVEDYATDFDHGHPDYNPRAPAVWKELAGRISPPRLVAKACWNLWVRVPVPCWAASAGKSPATPHRYRQPYPEPVSF